MATGDAFEEERKVLYAVLQHAAASWRYRPIKREPLPWSSKVTGLFIVSDPVRRCRGDHRSAAGYATAGHVTAVSDDLPPLKRRLIMTSLLCNYRTNVLYTIGGKCAPPPAPKCTPCDYCCTTADENVPSRHHAAAAGNTSRLSVLGTPPPSLLPLTITKMAAGVG